MSPLLPLPRLLSARRRIVSKAKLYARSELTVYQTATLTRLFTRNARVSTPPLLVIFVLTFHGDDNLPANTPPIGPVNAMPVRPTGVDCQP